MRPGACLCIHKVSPAESLRRLHFVGLPGWTAAGTVVGGLWVVEESFQSRRWYIVVFDCPLWRRHSEESGGHGRDIYITLSAWLLGSPFSMRLLRWLSQRGQQWHIKIESWDCWWCTALVPLSVGSRGLSESIHAILSLLSLCRPPWCHLPWPKPVRRPSISWGPVHFC